MALVLSCALVACTKADTPDAPKKEFTITFDTQGGSVVKPITIAEGATITLPRNPTKEGYIFDGWYLSDEFIEKFNATQTISSNITVYAKWKEDGGNQDEKQSYTITFDTQGGSEVKSLVLKEGETLTLPSNPTKEGSVFDGWYLDSSYTQAFDSTKRIDSNMVLYAKWKILDDGQSIIASDYFDISGLVLTMNKKNYIESTEDVFDLRNKFSTSNGSGWRAFTSPNCDQPTEITTRMANVSAGWNNIYVMVENLTTYRNQIYRLKIYKYPTIVYRELKDGFLEIQSVSDCADVLFPDDKIDKITSIGENAFSSCPSLHTLEGLPKLTNIGTSAFANCKRLTSIEVPNSVTTIPAYAFSGCNGLTSIVIPDSVTSIGNNAFYGCSGLTSITIPDSVTSIGTSAFSGCSGLTSVTIGNSVTSIGDYAFDNCTGLTSITVSKNNSAYASVDGILYDKNKTQIIYVPRAIQGAITIPDSVTSIGEGAFEGCTGLASISGSATNVRTVAKQAKPTSFSVNITSGTSIRDSAFWNCTGLTSVTIGNGVTSIGDHAFARCSGLTSIDIPDSVTNIGNNAFYECSGLTSIIIPNSVTSIGDYAFYGCYKLIEVYNKSALSITADSSSNGYVAYYAKNVYTNEGGSKLTTDENGYVIYKNGYAKILVAYHGTNTELILPSYITKIYQYAFYACSGLTSVTISDSVTSIGEYAFVSCTGLTSVTIGNSVTSIGDSAFYNCIGLTTVNWDATKCTSAGGYDYPIFNGCTNLKTVNIGENVKTIPSYAFRNCTGLTSITIPNSVTSIGESAFSGCSPLESITIPFVGAKAGVTSSDTYQYPFGYIFGTNSYTGGVATKQYYYRDTSSAVAPTYYIPSSLKSVTVTGGNILYGAFYNCAGLTSVTIPDSVTSIGGSAFSGCTGLTSIAIPDSVTSIGGYAFSGCTGLTSILVADGNTKYHSSGNCLIETASKTLILGCKTSVIPSDGSVTSIGGSAFYGCKGLTSVRIPDSVTSIGVAAFLGCKYLTSIIIPDSVTSIGESAFYGTAWYNNQPDGLVYAGKVAYKYKGTMPENTSLTLKEGTLGIAGCAFSGCKELTSVRIPDSVTSIGSGAFDGCIWLTSVTFNGTKEEWNTITKGSAWKDKNLRQVVCTDGTYKYYV